MSDKLLELFGMQENHKVSSNIAQACLHYDDIYKKVRDMFIKSAKHNVSYNSIKNFISTVMYPKIRECVFPYIADLIGISYSDSKVVQIACKRVFFTMAFMEQESFKTTFFQSVDRRIDVAACQFTAHLGHVIADRRLYKDIESKTENAIINYTVSMLKKRNFPDYVIDIVANQSTELQSNAEIGKGLYDNSKKLLIDNSISSFERTYKNANQDLMISNGLRIVHDYVEVISNNNTPFEALKEIINNSQKFYPETRKIFFNFLGAIPIGSYVKLRNECYGIVYDIPYRDPKNPPVYLIQDENEEAPEMLVKIDTNVRPESNVVGIVSYDSTIKMKKKYLEILKRYL